VANNLTSNTTRKLARVFLEKFENRRVLCKAVDSQLLASKFEPSSGSTVDFKRPHDYKTIRTPDGDLSSSQKSDIISGKATGTVQDYFTVATEWANIEEALELDQLDEILAPMATRMVTDLELDIGRYMISNSGLTYGDPDVPVSKWSDIAGSGALMDALGVPSDMLHYVMNPFTNVALADTQTGLGSGSDSLVNNSWMKATISEDFGGMRVMSSNALKTFSTEAGITDRAGTITGTPITTYLSVKDSMVQSISVDGFSDGTVVAGEVVEITGRHHLSLATREPIVGADGQKVKFRAVVTQDAVISGGTGTLLISGPAINEPNGQYNTADSAIEAGDVITLLGSEDTIYQPNLFFHKQAFGLGTVKLPKLYSEDTVATTEDGISIRVTRYSDGDSNKQKVRFDMLPAYATFNPFFAGKGFGTA